MEDDSWNDDDNDDDDDRVDDDGTWNDEMMIIIMMMMIHMMIMMMMLMMMMMSTTTKTIINVMISDDYHDDGDLYQHYFSVRLFAYKTITKTCLFKYIEYFTFKNWRISDKKNSDIFHVSAQNIDCGYSLEPSRRGGSNEYSQSMFLSINKKNNVYPCKPQIYYTKVGFKGVKII